MRTGIGTAIAVAAASVTLLAGGGPAARAWQQIQAQEGVFRGGIEVVAVDVGVVDRQGLPLRGLTADDFFVTVDGRPRRIVSAEFIDRSVAPPSAPAPASLEPGAISTNDGANVGRMFAFVVDQNTLDTGAARRVADDTGPLFSRLTFADRSALRVLPTGQRVDFTWAHDRVQSALQRIAGTGRPLAVWEHGSLAEARDIANRNTFALTSVSERVCGSGSGGGLVSTPGLGGTGGLAPQLPGATGGAGSLPTAPTSAGATRAAGSVTASTACVRDLQTQAELVWRTAEIGSLSSLAALRQLFAELGRIPGDKTVLLISGGWPLAESDEVSLLSLAAADAAAARVTLYTIFVPPSTVSAEQRIVTRAPATDTYVHAGPLENLASMTGGGSFRAETGATTAFERIAREVSAHYRIGIEKDPVDRDEKVRRLKVQVRRSGARVRAREIFDVRTYEDRNWTARLGAAVEGPTIATELGIRMTSYVGVDVEDGSRVRVFLSGEVTRALPGDAILQVVVADHEGRKIAGGDMPLDHPGGDTMPFAANVAVPPGGYIIRAGIMDSGGRVGSAVHRVDARGVALGPLTATGPLLTRVPGGELGEPRLALDRVDRDERLVLEVGLQGEQSRLDHADVQFEIAAAADGPALVRAETTLSNGARADTALAQAVANMRVLPPGTYVARARVTLDGQPLGELRRRFAVVTAEPSAATGAGLATVGGSRDVSARASMHLPLAAAPPFALDRVLAPQMLGVFLDRLAARPDASSPDVRELIARARASGPRALAVSDAVASASPVGMFLRGLTLLARNELETAAVAFREAMRGSADISPAMVYLGACYAAGGKDREASAVWRTAIIREGDVLALHHLLADALLRQGRADLAVDELEPARARWPEDRELARQFATAALLAGRQVEGLQVLDAAIARQADDEPTLALALYMLYLAFDTGEPIESVERDRERMQRLAQRYRAIGGPAVALVDTWVAAAAAKR